MPVFEILGNIRTKLFTIRLFVTEISYLWQRFDYLRRHRNWAANIKQKNECKAFLTFEPWSSLDKGESTGLPDNFPIQQKDRFFCKATFLNLFEKQPSYLLNGEVIWQVSDSSLTR